MVRWLFALLALVLGLVALKKENETMRFPEARFALTAPPCPAERYEGWFRELRRLACYPYDFPTRLEGMWGPQRVDLEKQP